VFRRLKQVGDQVANRGPSCLFVTVACGHLLHSVEQFQREARRAMFGCRYGKPHDAITGCVVIHTREYPAKKFRVTLPDAKYQLCLE
jgi:hypothetical protein